VPPHGTISTSIPKFQNSEPACVFGIVPGNRSVLGDTFLRSAYAVFNHQHNRISLAETNFESSSDNVVAIPSGGFNTGSGGTPGSSPTVPQTYLPSRSLSKGAKAGIGIGVGVCVLAIVMLALLYLRRRRRRAATSQMEFRKSELDASEKTGLPAANAIELDTGGRGGELQELESGQTRHPQHG